MKRIPDNHSRMQSQSEPIKAVSAKEVQEQKEENELSPLQEGEDANINAKKPCDTRAAHLGRIGVTIFINLAFLVCLGLSENLRGPTLLDLKNVYGTTVETISYMFLIGSSGSLLGAFFTGFIMEKFSSHQNLLMFCFISTNSLLIMILPHLKYLGIFFTVAFFIGFTGAAIDTGGNLLCLAVWRGRDSGPYMHSIHFSFSIGAFIAPLVAAPFLSSEARLEQGPDLLDVRNASSTALDGDNETKITLLYPFVGILSFLISLGFLGLHFRERSHNSHNENSENSPNEQTNQTNQFQRSVYNYAVVYLLAVFFFLYVGAEYSFGIFLTTFAVECDLDLTKVEGAQLTAIFWGFFAFMRFLAIFAAIKLNPIIIMNISLFLSFSSSLALLFLAEHSHLALQICSAILGFGMASIYATGLLWLEKRITIISWIGGLYVIAGSLGPDVFPVIIGQFIVNSPMFLMYITFGTVSGCTIMFYITALLATKLKKTKQGKPENPEEVLQYEHVNL